MSDKFDIVGVLVLASTGRSFRIELKDYPFSCPYYVSIKDLEDVKARRKKTATIYMLKKDR